MNDLLSVIFLSRNSERVLFKRVDSRLRLFYWTLFRSDIDEKLYRLDQMILILFLGLCVCFQSKLINKKVDTKLSNFEFLVSVVLEAGEEQLLLDCAKCYNVYNLGAAASLTIPSNLSTLKEKIRFLACFLNPYMIMCWN